MGKFYKFIIFIGLFVQLPFAYAANHDSVVSSKKDNNTIFHKESISIAHFLQPNIERSNPDLKHSNRIPVNICNDTTTLPLFCHFKENNLKLISTDQDINRCRKVSILLFPFHYFW